jgi:site-specific recombinase XerD
VSTISNTAAEYIDTAALSPDRAAAYRRLFHEIERTLGPMPVTDIAGLAALLDAKHAVGFSPGTIRKYVWMVRAFYKWAWENNYTSADTYLAVRTIKPPRESSRSAQPQRYTRTELGNLREILDERWPKMSENEALRWLYGVQKGRTPYNRVRRHVIRLQLDAVIALALHLGLRRREIFALDINDAHYYNRGVVVLDKSGDEDDAREVPFTNVARHALEQWIAARYFLDPKHDCLWLNLHASTTRDEPMSRHVFDKLLLSYVGEGWTLKRLRDTCIAAWLRSDLRLENVRELLGLSRIEEVLPHARLVPGSLNGQMGRLDAIFSDLVEPSEIAPQAEMAVLYARSPGSPDAENGSKDGGDLAVPAMTVAPPPSIYDPHARPLR